MTAPALYEHRFAAMGSPCEIRLFAGDAAHASGLIERAVADIARLEAKYSRYRDSSFLSAINRVAARGGRVEVDAETASLLDYADTCYQQSEGMFDISSGRLRQAWDFKSGVLPSQAQLDALLPYVGWHRLVWQKPWLDFAPGMALDFGGVVKEYAADRAANLCREHGALSVVVNLGGDVRVIGARPDGSAWRIGVQHPRAPDAVLDVVELRDGAIASSGDYARCMIVDGVRYGHVLNPKTGWPVRRLAAVSVVADFCVVAGSASTIAMLKDDAGPAWLAELGLPHAWVDSDGVLRNALR